MQAKEAIDKLDPTKWRCTSAKTKLIFLKQIQKNIKIYSNDLLQADCLVKKIPINDNNYNHLLGTAMQATIIPVASNIIACIDLYKQLIKNKIPKPLSIKKVSNNLFDILVFPKKLKDKILYGNQKGFLRIKDYPKQINPLKKKGGITAILSAGNYSSPFEIVRALFIDNCAVIHKAHPINKKSNDIWKKIFKPLIDYNALSFCNVNEENELIKDKRLTKIYFTGNAQTAKKILESTNTKVIYECGGNNPCIIVPGKKPWTDKQIKNYAAFIATFAKINGGAICARPQTLITCKNWSQRKKFLDTLKYMIKDKTPAEKNYYPDSEKKFANFFKHHPNANLIKSKNGTISNSDFLFIEDVKENDYAIKNEAFCQIIDEVALDTITNAENFLEKATKFCNTNLFGTLSCSILIDKKTQKINQLHLEKTIANLNYGSIAINTMPIYIWINPYLTWSGNDKGNEIASGSGNFENLMCYENVEKSIIYTSFNSFRNIFNTNKQLWLKFSKQLTNYYIKPSWKSICILFYVMLMIKFKFNHNSN